MEGPSGIGVAEFDWYQKNVHLVPCTWAEQLRIGERELERSLAYLELERQRNAALPPLRAAADLAELARRQKAAVAYFFDFLRRSEIFTVPGYMRRDSEVGGFVPPERRDCFTGSPTVIPCRSSATVSTGWKNKGKSSAPIPSAGRRSLTTSGTARLKDSRRLSRR
jgi:hypothetical protein